MVEPPTERAAVNPPPLPIDRRAAVVRVELDATSWVDVVHGFVPEPDALFEHLRASLPWTQGRSVRDGRMIPDPRLGASLRREQLAAIPILRATGLVLENRYRIRAGGIGLVMYRDGRDSVGFHRDDEMRYLDNTVVAAVCLGATRPVVLRPCAAGPEHVFELGNGDLYVMGGRCQADWLHALPKVEDCGPRISALWRWTSKQGPPVSSPTHFIADAPRKRHWR